jgi:hypothetical protein
MLTTVEAEIDVAGNVRLLEPLSLRKTSRAIVTVLDDKLLAFLENSRLPAESRTSTAEIKAQIKENQDSRD